MRRRHRRLLFNLFAFSLLALAVYVNMYRLNDKTESSVDKQNKLIAKGTVKTNAVSKITAKEN